MRRRKLEDLTVGSILSWTTDSIMNHFSVPMKYEFSFVSVRRRKLEYLTVGPITS